MPSTGVLKNSLLGMAVGIVQVHEVDGCTLQGGVPPWQRLRFGVPSVNAHTPCYQLGTAQITSND